MADRKQWTKEDRARHRAIREKYKNKPTIDELVASGELSGQPVPLGEYLAKRSAETGPKPEAKEDVK